MSAKKQSGVDILRKKSLFGTNMIFFPYMFTLVGTQTLSN